ncbi:MAG: hypothetical protein H7326_00135 [Bdellovibrionaceae bacterium]|nr:hypothetical protein [Pseudobdellovibrionaceae bacterium]
MKLRLLTFTLLALFAKSAMAADIFSDTCMSIDDDKRHPIEMVNVDNNLGRGTHLQIVTKDRTDSTTYIILSKESIQELGSDIIALGEVLSQDKANIRVNCAGDRRSVESIALFFKVRRTK